MRRRTVAGRGAQRGSGVGRDRAEDRYVFPLSEEARAETLRERVVAAAVSAAATDVVQQITARLH